MTTLGPKMITLTLAHGIAANPTYVPVLMLEAALVVASRAEADHMETLTKNRAKPGVRKRQADAKHARAVRGHLHDLVAARRRLLSDPPDATGSANAARAAFAHEVESIPALGAAQWSALIRYTAGGWHGTVAGLVTSVRGAVDDDLPLDLDPLVRWLRRKRRADDQLQAENRADSERLFAGYAQGDCARYLALVEREARDARASLERAAQFDASAAALRAAAALSDDELERFERLVEGGATPAEALSKARTGVG